MTRGVLVFICAAAATLSILLGLSLMPVPSREEVTATNSRGNFSLRGLQDGVHVHPDSARHLGDGGDNISSAIWALFPDVPAHPCDSSIPSRYAFILMKHGYCTSADATDAVATNAELPIESVSQIYLDRCAFSITFSVPPGGDIFPPVQRLISLYSGAPDIDLWKNTSCRPLTPPSASDLRVHVWSQDKTYHPSTYDECSRPQPAELPVTLGSIR